MHQFLVRRSPALLCVVALAGACVTPTQMNLPQLERLRAEREIVVVHVHDTPSFVLRGKAADIAKTTGGNIAAAAAVPSEAKAAGAKLVKDFGIENPLPILKRRVVARLGSDASLTTLRPTDAPVPADDTGSLKRALGPVTTLVVHTTDWGVKSHDTDPDVYGAFYEVRARLVRLSDETALWEGHCEAPKYWRDPDPASFDDMKANAGQLLKARITAAAERCADDLVDEFLNRRPTDVKRHLERKGMLLSDVRATLLGGEGLLSRPIRFEATFTDVPVPFGQAIEVVKLFADAREMAPDSEIKILGRTVNTPSESKLERTGAGRIAAKFDGLNFDDEAELRRVIEVFKTPALKELSVDGRVGERLIRIRLGPKGVER